MLSPELYQEKVRLEKKKNRSVSDNALLKSLRLQDMAAHQDHNPQSDAPYCVQCAEPVERHWAVCPHCMSMIEPPQPIRTMDIKQAQ